MSLLFADGFDHYSTSELAKHWDVVDSSVSVISSNQRTGIGGLAISSLGHTISRFYPNTKRVTVGAALWFTALPVTNQGFFQLASGGNFICYLKYASSSKLILTRQKDVSTTEDLHTTPITYDLVNQWTYIELLYDVHASNGAWAIRVNETIIASNSGIPTDRTDANIADVTSRLRLRAPISGTSRFDDIYIANDSGPPNDGFIGDMKVHTVLPKGNGALFAWTPLSGSNWDNVEEIPPDDDTTYVHTAITTNKDSYDFNDAPTLANTVSGVIVNSYGRVNDPGAPSQVKGLTRHSGGAITSGPAIDLGTQYRGHQTIFEEDPNASAPWIESTINAAEFGMEFVG